MKTAGLLIVAVAALMGVPAFAADGPAPATAAPAPGFFDRVLSVFDSSSVTPDAGNAPTDVRTKGATSVGVEPVAMDASAGQTDDKDSYKPDAGDAEH
jgi:hypothetical protein